MLNILHDHDKQALLHLELAATVDAWSPLVQVTYHLEGDGHLVFTCFEEVNKVLQAIQVAHYPNLNRVAERLTSTEHCQTTVSTVWLIVCEASF